MSRKTPLKSPLGKLQVAASNALSNLATVQALTYQARDTLATATRDFYDPRPEYPAEGLLYQAARFTLSVNLDDPTLRRIARTALEAAIEAVALQPDRWTPAPAAQPWAQRADLQ